MVFHHNNSNSNYNNILKEDRKKPHPIFIKPVLENGGKHLQSESKFPYYKVLPKFGGRQVIVIV